MAKLPLTLPVPVRVGSAARARCGWGRRASAVAHREAARDRRSVREATTRARGGGPQPRVGAALACRETAGAAAVREAASEATTGRN
ncbi:hypothetical protein GUJ93_ZPchr0004g40184 [Zizania palustris]|uniref:Uncharacterized protein n=1 Tax=Zizania palustris TaxID=103762 RepID=A0A8J5S1L4_ZIZPA|nr:hypothetical protein GUJ93_ZPchr0004g40184 [Zizania palustris]